MKKHIFNKKKASDALQKSTTGIQHTNKTEDTFNETIRHKKQENISIEIDPANRTEDILAHFDKEANNNVTKIFTPEQAIPNRLYNKSYARTWLQTSIIEYIWEINNVMTIFKIQKELSSPTFPETFLFGIKVTIDIDTLEIMKSILRFYLLTEKNFEGTCNVCIVHPSQFYKIELKSTSGLISNMTLIYETTLESLQKYIIYNKIVMYFEIEFVHKSVAQSIHANMMPISTALYERLNIGRPIVNFKPKELITFKIKEEYYSLPKKVLYATNSKYFKNICDNLKHKENPLVLINEMSVPFKQMLSFILSGIILDSFNYHMLRDLLIVAFKYDVQALKILCEFYLIRIINIKNSVDLIQLACSCDANTLKTHALSFIKLYLKDIVRIKEFQYLSQNDLDEIIRLVY